MIKRFQFAVSYLYYWIGDLTSKTPWFGWDPWSWEFYQFCMQESVKLDVDCKIWKNVESKAVTKARRRKVSKRGPRGGGLRKRGWIRVFDVSR